MKNYYQILEVSETATSADIKKSYRNLAKKYHPDKNAGDKAAEAKFKEISEAYENIHDVKKRKAYDDSRRPNSRSSRTNFDEWVRNHERTSGFRGRGRRPEPGPGPGASGTMHTDHLNILGTAKIDFKKALLGDEIIVNYKRLEHDEGFKPKEVSKSLKIHINLREKFIPIKKFNDGYYASIKLDNMGHEDVAGTINSYGEQRKIIIKGIYTLRLQILMPDEVELEGNNIIHHIDIPLYKTLFKGEKIRIKTIVDKEYDAEISNPKKLNDLKFNIDKQGLIDKRKGLGSYIVKFNIIPPDLSDVDKEEIDIIKKSFINSSD